MVTSCFELLIPGTIFSSWFYWHFSCHVRIITRFYFQDTCITVYVVYFLQILLLLFMFYTFSRYHYLCSLYHLFYSLTVLSICVLIVFMDYLFAG